LADYSARLAGLNVGGPAHITPSGDFGLIGLAVMGQNLIMNVADHKFTIVAFNRTVSKVDRFMENEAKGLLMSRLPPSLVAAALLMSSQRLQEHHSCSFHGGILSQAKKAPACYALGDGGQASG
jgi:hypothetical protein